MVNTDGYRLNVSIIIINPEQQVFWGKRVRNEDAWQFPQGGIQENETPEQSMYRELYEEVGLQPADIKILSSSRKWLTYDLPKKYWRLKSEPLCIGQKQKWFLVELVSSEAHICLTTSDTPEFSDWRWVDYWYPVRNIVFFKKKVYQSALEEFSLIVFPNK